jgi:hypothetical protein
MVVCLVKHNQTPLVSPRIVLEDTIVCEMTTLGLVVAVFSATIEIPVVSWAEVGVLLVAFGGPGVVPGLCN